MIVCLYLTINFFLSFYRKCDYYVIRIDSRSHAYLNISITNRYVVLCVSANNNDHAFGFRQAIVL